MPKNDTDIFDLSDLSDVPESVRRKQTGSDPYIQNKVIALLEEAGKPLTIEQLRVAMYRRHGYDLKNKNSFGAQVARFALLGRITRTSRGTYEAIK